MKNISIRYRGDESFLSGLEALQQRLHFFLAHTGKTVEAVLSKERIITVTNVPQGVRFTYYDKPSFFRAFSLALQKIAEGGKGEVTVKPQMQELGAMLNCSETVLNVSAVKEFIGNQALMGYTYIQLYTETTYEIPSEPYFGYQKGRFTQEELKEIVAYAALFGIEVVPCIQTLAHLSNLFKWGEYGEVHDIFDTLLVDEPKTYELIEKMFESLAQCFSTDKINLGMDEAYFMGCGRYNWFIDESKPDVSLLFLRHLKKVLELANKYGFTRPAIWFDNLFGINYKGYIDPPTWLWKDFKEEITEAFPQVRLIYWNYVIRDVSEFERFVGYVRQLSPNVSFASMAHGYTSFAPENYITEQLVFTASEGCKRCDISDLMITWWGAKLSPSALLPAYYNYAEKLGESTGIDFEGRCKFLFGYTYTEFKKLDIPNVLGEQTTKLKAAEGNNLPFYALANDPLLGTLDRHIPDGSEGEYALKAEVLSALSRKNSPYRDIFAFEAELCKTLSVRAELGKKIKSAYDGGDKQTLSELAESIPSIVRSVKRLHGAYKKYYLSFAKVQGSERWDVYFGGAILRLGEVKKILSAYLSGKLTIIPELEGERLPIFKEKDGQIISFRDWMSAATSC